MRKLSFLVAVMLCLTATAFSQDYVVQLAAFDSRVPTDYFKGMSGVYHVQDRNDIHRYYVSGFSSESDAENTAQQARTNGYQFARVINMTDQRAKCAASCGGPMPKFDPTKIKSIFFDFDKSFLRGESKRQLDLLTNYLKNHPEHHVELSAHTDAKGSLEYNKALSMRRANSAKDYLIRRGIPASQIKTSTFGEDAPIAKNELDGGRDTETGRQYNRRVELIVHNENGRLSDVVEEIDVPDDLKQ